jgi:hypothetical protein
VRRVNRGTPGAATIDFIMKYILITFVMIAIACTALQAQDTSSHQYTGKYKFPEGSVIPNVEVTMDNGVLMMSSTAGVSTLTLLGVDSFNIVSFNGYAAFKRNETKKIVAIHIEASGYVLDGVKDAAVVGSVVADMQQRKRPATPGICFPEKIYSNRQEAEKGSKCQNCK